MDPLVLKVSKDLLVSLVNLVKQVPLVPVVRLVFLERLVKMVTLEKLEDLVRGAFLVLRVLVVSLELLVCPALKELGDTTVWMVKGDKPVLQVSRVNLAPMVKMVAQDRLVLVASPVKEEE